MVNLLLIHPEDCVGVQRALIVGRRAVHLNQVLKLRVGDRLRVGQINGLIGEGCVAEITEYFDYVIDFHLNVLPPLALPLILVMALPRPKTLKRILQMTAGYGVKSLYLIQSAQVEKSFWSTPWLRPEAVKEQLVEGLAQVRDTLLPEVHLRRRFRPFVEDELPTLLHQRQGWVADPSGMPCSASALTSASLLCIGPEGGWVPFELDLLAKQGIKSISLGPRILRVEWAMAGALSILSLSIAC